jgi:aminoglycoside/choline kinase family phosphotransferase
MPLAAEDLPTALLPPALEISGAKEGAVHTMGGDASNRRYHRVRLVGGQQPSLVVMELPSEAKVSEEGPRVAAESELPFLNVHRYLKKGGLPVPEVHRYMASEGLIYLEDLGDVTLEQVVLGGDDKTRLRYYRAAIDLLVQLQRHAAATPDDACLAFGRGFDHKLLRWELDHFREWELEVDARAKLSEEDRALLDAQFEALASSLAAEPRIFVHRDFQSRNIMVQQPGQAPRLRLIDFQDALLGSKAYDLVALLRDSYVELAPGLLDELIGFYTEKALEPIERPRFRHLFDRQTVQRKLKDAGRFVYIQKVKGNPSFVRHIPSSLRYVRAALERLPELGDLRALLARYMPEFRDPAQP